MGVRQGAFITQPYRVQIAHMYGGLAVIENLITRCRGRPSVCIQMEACEGTEPKRAKGGKPAEAVMQTGVNATHSLHHDVQSPGGIQVAVINQFSSVAPRQI